jgi:hypothetical protein
MLILHPTVKIKFAWSPESIQRLCGASYMS